MQLTKPQHKAAKHTSSDASVSRQHAEQRSIQCISALSASAHSGRTATSALHILSTIHNHWLSFKTYLASCRVSSTTRALGCFGSNTHAQKAVFLSISLLSWPCRDLHHCLFLSTRDSCAIGMSKMLHSSFVMSSYFGSGLVSRMSKD